MWTKNTGENDGRNGGQHRGQDITAGSREGIADGRRTGTPVQFARHARAARALYKVSEPGVGRQMDESAEKRGRWQAPGTCPEKRAGAGLLREA